MGNNKARERRMYRGRMQQVVRVLKDIKREERLFDLNVWGTEDPAEFSELSLDNETLYGECGMVACSIGWSGLDPWFRRRGFRLEKLTDSLTYAPAYRRGGEEFKSWTAICKFFQIEKDKAEHLFLESRYQDDYTIDTVIDRINDYIGRTYGEEHVESVVLEE